MIAVSISMAGIYFAVLLAFALPPCFAILWRPNQTASVRGILLDFQAEGLGAIERFLTSVLGDPLLCAKESSRRLLPVSKTGLMMLSLMTKPMMRWLTCFYQKKVLSKRDAIGIMEDALNKLQGGKETASRGRNAEKRAFF